MPSTHSTLSLPSTIILKVLLLFFRVRLCDLAIEIARLFPIEMMCRQLEYLETVKGDFVLLEEHFNEWKYFSGFLTLYSACSDKKALLGLE